MYPLAKKHWTSFLGVLLIGCAFLYLFKYTLDLGWINSSVKIGIGLLAGAGIATLGIRMILNGKTMAGEIVCGLGAAVLYTTFSFAGIYYAIWDSVTVLLCMVAATAGWTALSFRCELRVLMNIALLGALASPLVLRPESDQVFTLFLYLLVLNAAYFYLSIRKSWTELRLVSFLGTWLLYAVYYFHFEPAVSGIWSLPYRYATAAFVFYIVGFLFSSWKNNLKFDGLNLYLGLVNAVFYGLWTIALTDGYVTYAYPMALIGLLYLLLAFLVYQVTGKADAAPVLVNFLGGVFLLLLAASQIGKGLDVRPLISVYLWGTVAAVLIAIGQAKQWESFKLASVIVWLATVCYWFVVTWDTPRGEWFGVYLPFLNWGAVSWSVLAGLGFYYSLKVRFATATADGSRLLANLYSLFSHLIVGGLLTVQVSNVFEEYAANSPVPLGLTLSVTWGFYALLLFLWGAYSRQMLFRAFGSAVLVLVAAKALLLDLAGEETIYKVLALLVLGCISFAATYINNRRKGERNPSDENGRKADRDEESARAIDAMNEYGGDIDPAKSNERK